jgi:hypothetical protein
VLIVLLKKIKLSLKFLATFAVFGTGVFACGKMGYRSVVKCNPSEVSFLEVFKSLSL